MFSFSQVLEYNFIKPDIDLIYELDLTLDFS